MTRVALALGLCAGLLATSPVLAHAMLEHATPKVGSRHNPPPSEVRLEFSEALEPAFSKLKVTGPHGEEALESLTPAPGDKRVLVARFKSRPGPGTYRVSWRVVSEDSHRTEGDFSFTVGP